MEYSKGRPRVRWEDDVRNDLRKMGGGCDQLETKDAGEETMGKK
jgi:hypothetical protein